MLDKLIQAAILTFLLHLVFSVSSNSTIPSNGLPSLVKTPNAIAIRRVQSTIAVKGVLGTIAQGSGGISQQRIRKSGIRN
ncbi:MAG: hypothetical protein HC903_13740 [Methylacidiphilales bacterium]|nr:hypothetical protein [Candidatus Methylacidiphilales bacterium]NJR14330.1 hypothetical protein [Calothrix sp. CSU_2_0]